MEAIVITRPFHNSGKSRQVPFAAIRASDEARYMYFKFSREGPNVQL